MWLTLMDKQKKRKLATTANQYFRILQFHWKESRTQEPIGKAGGSFFFLKSSSSALTKIYVH